MCEDNKWDEQKNKKTKKKPGIFFFFMGTAVQHTLCKYIPGYTNTTAYQKAYEPVAARMIREVYLYLIYISAAKLCRNNPLLSS